MSLEDRPAKKRKWWKRIKAVLCCSTKPRSDSATSSQEGRYHLDEHFNEFLEEWEDQHNLKSVEHHKAAEMLKAQVEEYEREIEQRQHKVEKRPRHHELRATEDKLPYEPRPIAEQWKKEFPVKDAEGGEKERVTNASLKSVTKDSKAATSSSASSTSDEMEQGGHMADLLLAIMQDAKSKHEPTESKSSYSNKNLADISRKNPKLFDHLVLENTKECLFLSLPTTKELANWDNEEARPGKMKKHRFKTQLFTRNPEIRLFCPTCKPRHWKTSCNK